MTQKSGIKVFLWWVAGPILLMIIADNNDNLAAARGIGYFILLFISFTVFFRMIPYLLVRSQLKGCLEKHGDVLATKYIQFRFPDDYGAIDATKWKREKKHFLNHVVPNRVRGYFSDEIIYAAIEKFSKRRASLSIFQSFKISCWL